MSTLGMDVPEHLHFPTHLRELDLSITNAGAHFDAGDSVTGKYVLGSAMQKLAMMQQWFPGRESVLRPRAQRILTVTAQYPHLQGMGSLSKTDMTLVPASKSKIEFEKKWLRYATLQRAMDALRASWKYLREGDSQGRLLAVLNVQLAATWAGAAWKENPDLAVQIIRTAHKVAALALNKNA